MQVLCLHVQISLVRFLRPELRSFEPNIPKGAPSVTKFIDTVAPSGYTELR